MPELSEGAWPWCFFPLLRQTVSDPEPPLPYRFNPFADMGVNPNDPNFLQSMMNSPEVQQQMNQMLQDPAVIDQMVSIGHALQVFHLLPPQILMYRPSFSKTDRDEPATATDGAVCPADDAGASRECRVCQRPSTPTQPLTVPRRLGACDRSRSSSAISSRTRKRCRTRCR